MTKIKLPFIHEYRDRDGNVRRYVRRRGYPKVTLPGLPGSPEFMEAYQAALAGKPVLARREAKAGTLGELVLRYYGSPRFDNLSPNSKKLYRHVLEKHVAAHGHRLISDLTADKAEKIISAIGAKKRGLANLNRSVLSAVFKYAVKLRMRPDNPFSADAIEPYKLGTHHTWTDDELTAFRARWPLGTRERLAFAVLLYTGQRVSDAVRLKRTDVFALTQQKTGKAVKIPMHPALARAVKAGPARGVYLIGDENGAPVVPLALTKLIKAAVSAAGLPARCKAHGLRKANQRILAENNATTKQMQAVSGHRTLRETERYSEEANQASLAASAIALFPDEE